MRLRWVSEESVENKETNFVSINGEIKTRSKRRWMALNSLCIARKQYCLKKHYFLRCSKQFSSKKQNSLSVTSLHFNYQYQKLSTRRKVLKIFMFITLHRDKVIIRRQSTLLLTIILVFLTILTFRTIHVSIKLTEFELKKIGILLLLSHRTCYLRFLECYGMQTWNNFITQLSVFNKTTKRTVLPEVASIIYPLDLLRPV